MRELTVHDLDAELAEQLPARELMGGMHGSYRVTNIALAGNNNGSWSWYVGSGNQNQFATWASSNGNYAQAG